MSANFRSSSAFGINNPLEVRNDVHVTGTSLAINGLDITGTVSGATMIGVAATAAGNDSTVIGAGALATDSATGRSVAVGSSSSALANATALGYDTSAAAGSIALGSGATAAANTISVGSAGVPISGAAAGVLPITVNGVAQLIPQRQAQLAVTPSAASATLTVASAQILVVTGTTAMTFTLPVVSTLSLGFTFKIVNQTNQTIVVLPSGGGTAVVTGGILTNTTAEVYCVQLTGTTNASWAFTTLGPCA